MKYFVSDNGQTKLIEVENKAQLLENKNIKLFEAMAQTYIGNTDLVMTLQFAVNEADFTVDVLRRVYQYQNIYTKLETTSKEVIMRVNPRITEIDIENLEFEAKEIAAGRISTIKRWNNVQNFKKELEQLMAKYDITCYESEKDESVIFEDNTHHNISLKLIKD